MDLLVSTRNAAVTFEPTTTILGEASAGTAAAATDMILRQQQNRMLWVSSQTMRMRSVALDLVVRLVLPLIHGFSRRLQGLQRLRGLSLLARNVQLSRRLLTNLLAYAANSMSLNLSTTVQVAHRIDPLLRMMKLRRVPAAKVSPSLVVPAASALGANISIPVALSPLPPLLPAPAVPLLPEPPERCVTLNVLASPPPGTPIRADIVFVHGLHGSLVNTWKQGLWNSDGRRVNFQRPPRPPVRPPKRPRHSRGSLFDAPHRSKRPKFGAPTSFSCPASPVDEDVGRSLESYLASAFEVCSEADASDRATSEQDFGGFEGDSWTDVSSGCEDVVGDYNDSSYMTEMEQRFPAFRLRDEVHSECTVHGDDDDDAASNRRIDKNGDDVDEDIDDVSRLTFSQQQNGRDDARTGARYSRCWPGDWLPLDCPGVRVIAVNYTTDPYLWRPLWIRKRQRTTLAERAREMSELLTAHGVGVDRPIVWVGHSKGGIFIKQIMVDAWESGQPAVAPLWRSARGCLFYSVPHRGSPLADFNLPLVRQSVELVEIKKNCPGVLELHRRFVALYRGGHLRLQIFSFVETALTLMSVLYLRIVGIDSADPGIGEVCGVHLDHREICKPRDRNCILYTKLKKMINQVS